jgi:hypothetical protein
MKAFAQRVAQGANKTIISFIIICAIDCTKPQDPTATRGYIRLQFRSTLTTKEQQDPQSATPLKENRRRSD